jgi:NAD(P)-dependent dehydrogenase (short-subunit alcohol dehydrogenase family)
VYTERLALTGRVAMVVGGGGGGIGTAMVEAFADAGAVVAAVDRDPAAAADSVARAEALGARGDAFVGDVLDDGEVARLVAEIVARLGRVDVVANVIGRGTRVTSFEGYTPELWAEVHQRTFGYVLSVARHVAGPMAATGGGCILNLSSLLARTPRVGSMAYGVAKAALEHLTRSLAVELGPRRIRANAVMVGGAATPYALGMQGLTTSPEDLARYDEGFRTRSPLGRGGRPSDIAAAGLFLCSDLASYITGQVLAVDGGVSLRYGD